MNNIQQRLKLIDKQLAGQKILIKHVIDTSPLLFLALGLIIGIFLQNKFYLPPWLWLILLTVSAAAAFTLFFLSPILYPLYPYLALICFACLGAIRLTSFFTPKPDDIRNLVEDEHRLATIRGVIVTKPYINKNQGWQFARFAYTDPASSFYLKVEKIEAIDGWAKTSGTVRVQVNEPVLDLKAGDYIQAYCRLDRFRPSGNPGQFDTAKYLARKNVFIAASIESQDAIELRGGSPAGSFAKIKRKLREAALEGLAGDLTLEGQNGGLLQALVLGYRADIDSSTYTAFRKTGLLHFVCLSGMNFGIVIGIVWWVCKTLGLMKPARAAVCIVAAIVFLMIVPPNAPALRAGIVSFIFCASFFFRRHPNSLNSLSLAAIVLLMINPTDLFDVSWQLSFASVLGILLFTDRIHFFLYEKITDNWWFEQMPKARALRWSGAILLNLFSVSLAAWLASAGILLYHFYTINWLTSIWTVIVSPLIALVSIMGYLKTMLAMVLPSASLILGLTANELSSLLIWIVKLFASLDISEILIGKVPAWIVVFYYGFVFFAGFAYFRRPVVKTVILTASAMAMIVFLGATKWQRTHHDSLYLTCLDVGHGQAILAKLPGKANILFDAGSLHTSDIGNRTVVPFLNYNGINKIDGIIISHSDVDHINGIPEIIENCKVSGVYADKVFFEEKQKETVKFLNDWLNKKGVKKQSLDKDLNPEGGVKMKFIWPNEQICPVENLDDNDKSLVCLIEFAGKTVLLSSDIENLAQRKVLEAEPNLRADIVVVPHHGSIRTSDADFLEKLRPDISIVSCNRKDYERQQAIRAENKSQLFYTARNGVISICIDKNGTIKTSTFRK